MPHGGNMCAGRELKSVVLRARPSRVPLVVAVIAATLKDTSIPRNPIFTSLTRAYADTP